MYSYVRTYVARANRNLNLYRSEKTDIRPWISRDKVAKSDRQVLCKEWANECTYRCQVCDRQTRGWMSVRNYFNE
jgi:hypothetical protein